MIEGKGYVEIKSINDAMIALHNYENIWRYEHPLCYGPQALFRAMFEQHIQGKVPTAAIMIDFCNNIIEQNAIRASRREVPLDYDECLTKWEQRLRKGLNNNNVYAAPASGKRDGNLTLPTDVVNKMLEAYSREGKRFGNNQSFRPNKKAKKPLYCFKFNSEN